MVRSAAKNHAFVTIVTDPADYDALLEELAENDGATTLDVPQRAWRPRPLPRTAAYDAAISQWFAFAEPAPDPFGPRR